MKLKTRLITSNIAMTLVPVILLIATVFLIDKIISSSLFNEKAGHGSLNIGWSLRDNNYLSFSKIQSELNNNPKLLESKTYLSRLEGRLKTAPNSAGIIFKKGPRIAYISPELFRWNLKAILNSHHSTFCHNRKVYTINRAPVVFKDRSIGTVLLISDITPITQTAKIVFLILATTLILTIIATNGLLTFWISKSVTKPLDELKKGVENIKAENLNFQITPSSKDELGELASAFEEMRSKLKDSLDAQIQYDNNRKELITAISHDLKTPVTSIKGYVEGIIDGVADTPEKYAKYLKTIYNKANLLDRMIDELFLFSKLDLKKVPFHFEKVNIDEFIADCIEELRFELSQKNISLDYRNNLPQGTYGIIDREKVYRVIMNIVSNAVKYLDDTKEQKQISFTLTSRAEWITIQVTDNGIGIKAEALPHIFDRFYRADGARNSATGGTGLGLAIAKLIIEEHGGTIWVESNYGIGTTISFTLKKARMVEE